MTVVKDFNTNVLYPGGQGKCKVGTEDLYPSDPWYVNVNMADLHKWMWNLEEWSANLDMAVVLKDNPSDTYFLDVDISQSGKYHHAEMYINDFTPIEWDGTGRVLTSPPNTRACGKYYQTTDGSEISATNSTGAGEFPMPYGDVGASTYSNGTFTGSLTISDGTSAVGDADISFTVANNDEIGLPSSGAAGISFRYIRLRGNGTADVYFTAECTAEYSDLFIEVVRLSPVDDPATGETSTSYTISILGKNVTAYVITAGGSGGTAPAPDSFSFTYAITVTTPYTYS